MYKLILVDDEEEVRKGIIQKIKWEQYGFELVGEAENGREALEMAEKFTPDVVITDIKMPFMDGLQLSEELRKRFPTIKIIILTGFDKFEYAQKAVNLNVVEYALKPVSSKEFIEVLLRVKAQIDEEMLRKKDMEAMKEYYVKSLPILKGKFLTYLITSKLNKEEIEEKCKNYNIDLKGNRFVVAAININRKVKYKDKKIDNSNEVDLIKFGVINIIEEILCKRDGGIVFIHNDLIVLISPYLEEDRGVIFNSVQSTLEEIRQNIEKYLKLTITIGLGTIISDVSHISDSYQNAILALDYRFIMGNNRIIWIEDIEPSSSEKIVFDEIMEHDLRSSIKVGTENEIIQTIDGLFYQLLDVKAPFKHFQIYLLEILTTIIKTAESLNVDLTYIFGENYNLFVELYEFNDLNQVKNWFEYISIKIMNYITKDRQDSCTLLVEKTKAYINKYYSDSSITINSLCNYLYISPTYFSFIFKKETKMTFINYLTQIRMDASKELIKATKLKSFEIAYKVGYAEPNYFSYCFKKHFGISPSEYRNNKFNILHT
ncbi:response regulator [Clostridium estertheticum]|uniref:response regulator n=1 Tax=Clostridium estertheticum TaxID=238834 RepID=UPI0013E98E24|nr:response regulator [Clostridium estertheticum]MBZ9688595.1 response regulator [Clostridium estertheticum]